MRQLISGLVFDTDKADSVGFILRSSGTIRETMYATRNGRYFLLIEELDSSPVYQKIVPVSWHEYNQWMQDNRSILNSQPYVKPMPLVTSFLNVGKNIDNTNDLRLLFTAINAAR